MSDLLRWFRMVLDRLRSLSLPPSSKRPVEPVGDWSIVVDQAWGASDWLRVRGRVLPAKPTLSAARPNLLRRLLPAPPTSPRPTTLTARAYGSEISVPISATGEFDARITPGGALGMSAGWHELELFFGSEPSGPAATAEALVPSDSATYAVVGRFSGPGARGTSRWGSLLRRLLKRSGGDAGLSGLSDLYRSLAEGGTGRSDNPVFYLPGPAGAPSGGRAHGPPAGPLLATGGDPGTTIIRLLDDYPDLPFVLVGSARLRDPTLFLRLARTRPGRIVGVYIVDDDPSRSEAAEGLGYEIRAAGVPAVSLGLSRGLQAAAGTHGLIPAGAQNSLNPGETNAGS